MQPTLGLKNWVVSCIRTPGCLFAIHNAALAGLSRVEHRIPGCRCAIPWVKRNVVPAALGRYVSATVAVDYRVSVLCPWGGVPSLCRDRSAAGTTLRLTWGIAQRHPGMRMLDTTKPCKGEIIYDMQCVAQCYIYRGFCAHRDR